MADLAYSGVLEHYVGEDFDEEFDFDGLIPEATTVTAQTVTVVNNQGSDVTDTVLQDQSHSGTVVTLSLYTGTSEAVYLIKVSATASDLTKATMAKLLNVTVPGVYQ